MCKEYLQIAEGYRMIAAGYEALAQKGVASGDEVAKEPKKAGKKSAVTEEEQAIIQPQAEEKKKITIEDVRAVMRAKNKEGKLEQCQAVLREFNVAKLSDIPEEKYSELLQKVEVL